jgi:uncharacterized protein
MSDDETGVSDSRSARPATLRSLGLFFVFLVLIAGAIDVVQMHIAAGGKGYYALVGMWSPGLAALLTLRVSGRDWAELGWHWNNRLSLVAFLVPLAYTAAAYTFVWSTNLGALPDSQFVANVQREFGWESLSPNSAIVLYAVFQGTFGVLPGCVWALGEEIGWRGFLLPELARVMGFTRASLVSGVVWFAFHIPVAFFADSNMSPGNMKVPRVFGLACFAVMILAMSFMMAWLRLRSGGLWAAMIFHGSHNVFVQDIFTPLTVDTGRTAYFVDEFGIPIAVTTTIAALFFWVRRSRVSAGLQSRGAVR